MALYRGDLAAAVDNFALLRPRLEAIRAFAQSVRSRRESCEWHYWRLGRGCLGWAACVNARQVILQGLKWAERVKTAYGFSGEVYRNRCARGKACVFRQLGLSLRKASLAVGLPRSVCLYLFCIRVDVGNAANRCNDTAQPVRFHQSTSATRFEPVLAIRTIDPL